jgi:hypothetical protein
VGAGFNGKVHGAGGAMPQLFDNFVFTDIVHYLTRTQR